MASRRASCEASRRWVAVRRAEPEPALLEVAPPRTGERTLLAVEQLLSSMSGSEPIALELAGEAGQVRLFVRSRSDELVRGQFAAHYPQARLRDVPPEADPLWLGEGERAWSMTLRSSGPPEASLRTARDRDLLDPGSDPLLGPLGALSALRPGERAISRLLLRPLGPDWSRRYQAQLSESRAGAYAARPQTAQTNGDPLALTVLGLALWAALEGYRWLEAGDPWKLAALASGAVMALAAGHWLWRRWRPGRRGIDPELVREKTRQAAFLDQLELVAVLPPGSREDRARELLEGLAAAYRRLRPSRRRATARGSGQAAGAKCHAAGTAPSEAVRPSERARRARGGRALASARPVPGDARRRPLGRAAAAASGGNALRRRGGRRDRDRPARAGSLPRGSARPPPALRRPHPHGQVDLDAPHRAPQARAQGARRGPGRRGRGRSARRPGRGHPRGDA